MNRIETATLPLDRQRHFQENGYLFPIPVLTADEAASYRSKLEAFEAEQGPSAKPVLRQRPHLVLTWVDELIRQPRVIAAVSSLLGPDLLVWGSSFFIKDPGDPGYVSWHQDSPYWGLDNDDTITAWIALAPSVPENGCMRVVPGSQAWPRQPHHDTHAPENLLSRGQEIAVDVDEAAAVDLILAPGEASLHNALIVHGSNPNTSDIRRIGLAVRYIRPAARQVVAEWDSASLVAGEDRYGNFQLEPRPERDMDPGAVAYREMVMTRDRRGLDRRP